MATSTAEHSQPRTVPRHSARRDEELSSDEFRAGRPFNRLAPDQITEIEEDLK
jgi:hypothetical protein